MSGGIDNVDTVFRILLIHPPPETGRCSRGDGDAALLLLFHPVHGRRAVMDLTDLVRHTGVEQDALGRRGLPGIDVRHDADVAIALNGGFACHDDRP